VLSPCALPLPPTCLLVTANEARSYFASTIYPHRRSQWPRSLWRRSAVAWLLGSRVRIPLGAWMFVALSCVSRGLCDGMITRPEESYRVSVCVCDQETLKREVKGTSRTISACEWMNEYIHISDLVGSWTERHSQWSAVCSQSGVNCSQPAATRM
jgi:hypothetical protein